MPLNLTDIKTANGGWFKPKDNADATAILLEVKQFDHQMPTPMGPRDSVLADVTVFKTPEQLQQFAPEVSKGQRIEQTVLAASLKDHVGKATLVTVTQVPPKKPGGYPAWVWQQVTDPAIRKQVIAYAEQRDAAVDQAVADAPDFD